MILNLNQNNTPYFCLLQFHFLQFLSYQPLPYLYPLRKMDNFMSEQSSASDTFSFCSQPSSCHIDMEVYYTAILRDPSAIKCDSSIPKRRFKLTQSCTIMSQKENAKVKIANNKKQFLELLSEGYFMVAEVKFHALPNGKYSFSIQKPSIHFNRYQSSQSFIINQKIDINTTVFYQIKRNHPLKIENQSIKNNDLLKFGKQIYHARIYSKNSKSFKIADWLGHQKPDTLKVKQSEGECKICLMSEGQFMKDYVVSPCKCSGTCSSVHIECLKNWINQRVAIGKKYEKLQSYDTGRFSCEICKQKYPEYIQVNSSIINISPERSVQDETLVLTKVYPLEDEKRISHLIELQKNSNLTIGRHYYNELQLQDMSISRNHAVIQRSKDGDFYLHDKNARFGTFISLRNPVNGLNQIILLTNKQTFSLKLVCEQENIKQSRQKIEDDEMTAEKIQQ